MFVVAMKTTRRQLTALCVAVGLIVAFGFGIAGRQRPTAQAGATAAISMVPVAYHMLNFR